MNKVMKNDVQQNTIIFDLDGTLANVDKRRDLAMKSGKMDWDVWFNPENIQLDEPNEPVVKTAQLFAETGFTIAIFSGRLDTTEKSTRSWLARHRIPFHFLNMRPVNKKFVPDDVLKKSWLLKHEQAREFGKDSVFMVVDDRQKVVDMWRGLGLTVFQVAPGDF
jgi:hypothetical protein